MKNTIKPFMIAIGCWFAIAGCGNDSMTNPGPKKVLTVFFERMSKQDVAGARELATKESQPVLNVLERALALMNENSHMVGEPRDILQPLSNLEIGAEKIEGDLAFVTIRKGSKNEFDFPLKKEGANWKVDYSPLTMSKIKNKPGWEDRSPEDIKKEIELIDSVLNQ